MSHQIKENQQEMTPFYSNLPCNCDVLHYLYLLMILINFVKFLPNLRRNQNSKFHLFPLLKGSHFLIFLNIHLYKRPVSYYMLQKTWCPKIELNVNRFFCIGESMGPLIRHVTVTFFQEWNWIGLKEYQIWCTVISGFKAPHHYKAQCTPRKIRCIFPARK